MFNLLRLMRRNDHIDDAATAYVEARATERDKAELADRASKNPDLYKDLDSLRDTVSMLRSVEPVKAPRSFALAHAPVQARVKRSRIAMAPAVFAIAAAAAVGLLAVGNFADVVHQNDGSLSFSTSGSSEDSAALNRDAGQTEITALAAATSTPAASNPTAPLGTPAAPSNVTQGMHEVGPDAGGGEPEQALPLVAPGGDGAAVNSTEVADGSGAAEKGILDDPMALPESTATGLFGSTGSLEQDTARQRNGSQDLDENRSGFALPLWQLQVVFASIAVLMAAAWMLLQRKLTA